MAEQVDGQAVGILLIGGQAHCPTSGADDVAVLEREFRPMGLVDQLDEIGSIGQIEVFAGFRAGVENGTTEVEINVRACAAEELTAELVDVRYNILCIGLPMRGKDRGTGEEEDALDDIHWKLVYHKKHQTCHYPRKGVLSDVGCFL